MTAVSFRDVDIVFGPQPRRALEMLDAGKTREEVLRDTGHVIGVAGASLDVAEGQICVLMGLSGSGKSTLLRAVNRLNIVSRGDVVVRHGGRDVNVSTCDATTLRGLRSHGIAMVFQQFALLPWRTVRDNVGIALEMRGVTRRERDRVVDEKLAMVGLTAWAEKHAHELSGGMQQRVGLARAFSTDADILLMDEPFSALDPLIRARLQDELLALQARLRKTILFVSHDLDEAVKLGNRIVIMEGGRIIQAGTVEDIVLRPATPYVADFVKHMNPLRALKAANVMRPLADLARAGEAILLDADAGGLRIDLDANGRACGASAGGQVRTLVDAKAVEVGGPDGGAAPLGAVLVVADMALRDAVHLRRLTRRPLLVTDTAGQVIGLIGEHEILHGLGSLHEGASSTR